MSEPIEDTEPSAFLLIEDALSQEIDRLKDLRGRIDAAIMVEDTADLPTEDKLEALLQELEDA